MKEHKTLEGILSGTYKKYGWAYQPKIVGGCPHEHIALEAMQEYSDQQNAELTERVKELEGKVSELRTAFANYHASEGCSCCRDSDNHRDAEHAIGELLEVSKHDDDSGYDFNQYQTIYK